MLSSKFENIINSRPASASGLALAEEYLESAASQQRLHKLHLDPRIIQKIGKVNSSAELAVLISLLLSEHILKRVIVAESPAGGGVAEYSSLDEVPDDLHDHLRDTWMRVTLDDVRTIYIAEAR